MPDLTLIDLSHNKINVIEYSSRFTLDNLPNLRFLYLNHNGMQKFYLELLGSPNIELLDASYNNFNFDSWWFNFPKSTEVHLNVAFSGVTTIRSQKDIYGCVKRLKANNNLIRDLKIEPGMQLEELELSSNKISDIRSLTRLHNLRVFDLSENPLQNSLKGDIFVNLTALTHLSLKNTRTTIKKDLLEMNTNLKFLDLSNNQIGNFDLHTLKNLTNLEILRLDSNGMEQLIGYEDVKMILPQLNSIGLSHNNFSCSYLQSLVKVLQNAKVELSTPASNLEWILLNFPGIKCVSDGANITESLFSMDYNILQQEVEFKEDLKNKTTSIRVGMEKHEQQINDLFKRINYTEDELTITQSQLENALTNVKDKLLSMADSINIQEETLNNKTLSIQGDQNKQEQQLQNELNSKAEEIQNVFKNLTQQLVSLENITKCQEEIIRSVQDDVHNGIVVISAILTLITGSVLVILLRAKCKRRIDKDSVFLDQLKLDEM